MAIRILPVNFFDEATISVTPSAVSTFPVTNLQSNVRDRLWRSPNLDRQVISGTWSGNARPINSWGIWPGSLMGAQVRVQLYSDSAYTTQVYDSGTLDVFAFSGTGWGSFPWGGHPWGVDPNDRTASLAPLLRYFTEVTAASFRVTITNGGAMAGTYFEACRIWLAQSVAAPYNARRGMAPSWVPSGKSLRTPGGTLRRQAGGRWRELRLETFFRTDADRATWLDLMAACTPDKEVVLSLFPGENSRRERDFTVMGSLQPMPGMPYEDPALHTLQLAILES